MAVATMSDLTYIGRQSIYDANDDVFGYELLYRNSEQNWADITDDNHATAELLSNVFTSIGLDTLVGNKRAFVNMPREFLLGNYPLPEIKQQLVIEILEHVQPDADVLAALKKLKQQGYTLALDDYVFEQHLEPFLEIADIIKIDIMASGMDGMAERVVELQAYNVELLAEKVETAEEAQVCRDLGFKYFQGYYFSRPKIVSGKKITGNQLATMQLMSELNRADVTTEELAALIQQDIAISYKLLRYVNSAMYSFNREIESIRDAIVVLGMKALVKLVNMVAIGSMGEINDEAYRTAMFRARMCEAMAQEAGHKTDAPTYFLVGLFSNLDALLGVPMPDVLDMLPLADEIKQALLDHTGGYGETLATVIAYEQDDFDNLDSGELDPQQIVDCYIKAIAWADGVSDLVA